MGLTMGLTAYEHYQDYLHDVFLERQRRNERYSLRSFARSLNISPAMLTGILQRRKGLSLKRAMQISEKLNLAELDSAFFCDLVVAAHSRSRTERKLSAQRVSLFKNLGNSRQRERDDHLEVLHQDEVEYLRSWYYSVLLEYINLRGSISNLAIAAGELNLGVHTLRGALERLCKLELVERSDHGYRATGKKITTSVDVPSAAIRDVHKQFLDQAKQAIEQQSVSERDFSVAIVGTDATKLGEAKKKIEVFRRDLQKFMESDIKPDLLYAINIQMFSLLKIRGGNSDDVH